ncbi:fimbrial protein [Salmonella enterica]|nr:fimbrial protein [Salmonella enterica]
MIRKTLIAVTTIAAIMGSAAAFAVDGTAPAATTGKFGGGTISFTGSVTEAPCSIPPSDVNQTIALGSISNKVLVSSSKTGSDPVPVHINLKNCDVGGTSVYSKVSVKFLNDGKIDKTGISKGLLITTGSATGVSVQLLDNERKGIDFTSNDTMRPATEVPLATGVDASLTFYAHMIAKTGSTTPATAGTVSAQVAYQLDYH